MNGSRKTLQIMKYSVQSSAPVNKPATTKHRVTWQDAFEALEYNQLLDKVSAKKLAKDLEANEVFNNLTVAQVLKASGSLESLGTEAMSDMSKAFGRSVDELKTMSVESFISLTDQYMPKEVEPSNEIIGAEVALIAIFAFYLAIIAGAVVMASKMTKYEFWWNASTINDQALKRIIDEKGLQAITEIMVDCFDKKDFDSQIKACNAITKFLSVDMKKVYEPSFKIVDIEKLATALWSAPQGVIMTNNSTDTYLGLNEWFQGWSDNYPKHEMKTLGDHGFKFDTLKSTCNLLIDMARELVKLRDIHADIKNGHVVAKKEITPGFWKSIKLFFTEKKEDREARKQAELILNAKYMAMKYLIHGYDWSVRTMCGQFFTIAVKTDKYVTAK